MPEAARRAAHANISYEKTIAPMLIDNCVTCHRHGGIGPWQMTSYEMVKGFAPMIREVIRTERMPPWHADPHYGAFKNDRALSVGEHQDAGPLDRSRRTARRRVRSPGRPEEDVAGVVDRQARSRAGTASV